MRILLAWEQGLGYGHLGHLIPLGQALKDMGAQVSLAARYLENVWAAGELPFDQVLPAPNCRAVKLDQETRTFSDVIRPDGFANVRQVTALARGWQALFDIVKPDIVICEHAFNAVFAARATSIPVARLGTGFTAPAVTSPMTPMRAWNPHDAIECAAADKALLDVLNEAADALGAQRYGSVGDLFGYGEEFVVTWPELDHLGPQSDRHYYGPLQGLGARGEMAWPISDAPDTPRAFIYLPEAHPLEQDLLTALDRLGWPTVYHSRRTEADLGRLQVFSPKPLSMPTMLARADVFINHASHGSCADALRAGCAMMLCPNTFERALVGLRLVKAGAAMTPETTKADAASLEKTLRAVQAGGCANTRALKVRYADYDPASAVRELAEDMLEYARAG